MLRFLIIVSGSLFAAAALLAQAVPGGLGVSGTLTPSDVSDTLAVTETRWQRGGFRTEFTNRDDWTNLTIFPMARRQRGTVAVDPVDPLIWQVLQGNLTTWSTLNWNALLQKTNDSVTGLIVADADPNTIAVFGADRHLTFYPLSPSLLANLTNTNGSGGGGGTSVDPYSPIALGAAGDGVADDTIPFRNAVTAATLASRPCLVGPGIYRLSFIDLPAGAVVIGDRATLRGNAYPVGTNLGILNVRGNDVEIRGMLIDNNRAQLSGSRVQVSGSWVRTPIYHGVLAEGVTGFKISDCVFTNGFGPQLTMDRVTRGEAYNLRFVDAKAPPQVINSWRSKVKGVLIHDSHYDMSRMDPFGFLHAYNYDCDFEDISVRDISASDADDVSSDFLSGVNGWANSYCRYRNLSAVGVGPLNTKTPIGILFDGSFMCTLDGFTVMDGWTSPGLELMAPTLSSFKNGLIDHTGAGGTSTGILILNESNNKGPGPENSSTWKTALQRGRSQGGRSTIEDVTILNPYNGVSIGVPNLYLRRVSVYGAGFVGISLEDRDGNGSGGPADTFLQRGIIRMNDVVLDECVVRGSAFFGGRAYGGRSMTVVGGDYSDNGQAGFYCAPRYVVTPSTGSWTTSVPVGSSSAALSTTDRLDGRRINVFTSAGVFVQTRKVAEGTTTTTIIPDAAFSPAVTQNDRLCIVPWDQDDWQFTGVRAGDSQDWTETGTVSFDPIAVTNLTSLTSLTFTEGTDRLFPGQKLRVKGIATGGGSTDVIVRVEGWTRGHGDVVQVTPQTLGNGASLAGSTLVVPTTPLAGVWNMAIENSYYGAFTQGVIARVTPGAGASIAASLRGFYFLVTGSAFDPATSGVARAWQLKNSSGTFTAQRFVRRDGVFTPNFTAGTLSKVAVTVEAIPSQQYGIRFNQWMSSTRVTGAKTVGNITAGVQITASPNTTSGSTF